jgi:hypothetical protein
VRKVQTKVFALPRRNYTNRYNINKTCNSFIISIIKNMIPEFSFTSICKQVSEVKPSAKEVAYQ